MFRSLIERAAKILHREIPSYGRDDVYSWFRDYWSLGGQTGDPEEKDRKSPLPPIVCLCGSTRFYEEFQRVNYELTVFDGYIVLSVGFYPHAKEQVHGGEVGCTPEQKEALDELHLRKIDLADEVFVINKGGYVGDSTCREIRHAIQTGKPIRWLEPQSDPVKGQWGQPVVLDDKDGYWYFWNEVWSDRHGPFNTRNEAVEACKRYSATL